MIQDFLQSNWIEIAGVIISLIYLYFSIQQKIWLWPFGCLSALFYIVIYFQSKFYADMGLQFYYFFVSIYGWVIWNQKNITKDRQDRKRPVSRTKGKVWKVLILFFLILWAALFVILKKYTDSDIPGWDAMTTAASIIATWMLARKLLEHWLLWIVIDLVSMSLYIYKELYPTSILFAIYTVMAFVGYRIWVKKMKNEEL